MTRLKLNMQNIKQLLYLRYLYKIIAYYNTLTKAKGLYQVKNKREFGETLNEKRKNQDEL